MRIFHTSDWHLGQQFFGHAREYEHQQFLDWLLQRLVAEQPDVLLVAGDIFDTANPPIEAQSLLYRFLTGLHRQCPRLQVILIAGNHDSGARIELPQPLLAALNVHSIGRVSLQAGQVDLERLLIPIQRDGQRLGWCLAVPYLRPAEVTRNGQEAMAAYAALYRQLIGEAQARQQDSEPLVLVTHAHVRGGVVSAQSERNLIVGAVEAIPLEWFAGVDYVALGHLHKAHPVGQPHIRYSGSPLPLSMAEQPYRHQVLDVQLQPGRPAQVQSHEIPRAIALHRLGHDRPCALDDILQACAQLPEDPRPVSQFDWLEITIALQGPAPADLRQQLQQALAQKSVRLLRYQLCQQGQARGPDTAAVLGEMPTPEQLFMHLWQRTYPEASPAQTQTVVEDFALLLEQVRHTENTP